MHLSKSKIIIGISVLIALSVAGCLLIVFFVSKLSDYLGSRPEYLMAKNFVTHSPACQALLAEGETWKVRSMSVHYSRSDGRDESNGAYSFVIGSWLFPDKEVDVRWRREGNGPIRMEAYNTSRDFDPRENLPQAPVQVEVGVTIQSPPEGLIDSATLPMDGSDLNRGSSVAPARGDTPVHSARFVEQLKATRVSLDLRDADLLTFIDQFYTSVTDHGGSLEVKFAFDSLLFKYRGDIMQQRASLRLEDVSAYDALIYVGAAYALSLRISDGWIIFRPESSHTPPLEFD